MYWSQTSSFTDVAAEKWCNNAISTLFSIGIIDGYGDGAFRPDGPITRAAFTKMAVNFFDYHVKDYDGRFTDVEGDAWYAGYIQAAAELKLIEGFDEMLPVFINGKISEVYYEKIADDFKTIYC